MKNWDKYEKEIRGIISKNGDLPGHQRLEKNGHYGGLNEK